MAALQCVTRLSRYLCVTDYANQLLLDLCGKIETFCWSHLVSFVPKIRHNARHSLTEVVKIYRHLSTEKLSELGPII